MLSGSVDVVDHKTSVLLVSWCWEKTGSVYVLPACIRRQMRGHLDVSGYCM